MAYDINKILAEYGDDDFGFSAVSEEEYNKLVYTQYNAFKNYKMDDKITNFFTPFLI